MDVGIADYTFPDGSYYITIKAIDAAGNSNVATTNEVVVNTALDPIPTVKTDGIYVYETKQIHFIIEMQNPKSKVIGYQYRIANHLNATIVDWQQITTTELEYDIIHPKLNLQNGRKYFIEVQAKYGDNEVTESGWGNVTIDSTSPTNLTVDTPQYTSSQNLKVTWSAVEDISSVRYWAKIGTTANGDDLMKERLIGRVGQHVFTDIAAVNGDILYVTVTAENSSGLTIQTVSAPIIVDNVSPFIPYVVDGGSYTNIGTQLRVTWDVKDDADSGIENFQVALLETPSVNDSTIWTTVAGTEQSHIFLSNLVDGKTYYIAVKVVDRAGLFSTGFSDGILVDSSRPAPPSIILFSRYIAQGNSSTTLTADVTGVDTESGILGYYYSLGTADEFTALVDNERITDSNVIGRSGLLPMLNTPYYFNVVAQNNAEDISAAAMSDSITVIDSSEPRIETVTDEGTYSFNNNRLFFMWNINGDAPVDHYEYSLIEVENTETFNQDDTQVADDAWVETTEKVLQLQASEVNGGSPFEEGHTYYLVVRAVNKLGIPTIKGISDGIKIDTTPPTAPVLTTAPYVSNNFKLSWNADDLHSGIKGYEYAIGTTRGGTDITNGWKNLDLEQLNPGESTKSINRTVLIENLTHQEVYYLSVKAENGAGLWSNPVMSGALFADLQPPTQPIVTAPAFTTDVALIDDVSFTSDDEDSGIVAYRVAVVQSNTLTDDLTTDECPVEGTQQNLSVSNLDITNLALQDGQTYYVAVQTKDQLGQWSDIGYSHLITMDCSAPELSFDAEANELVTITGTLDVEWSTNELGKVYYRLLVFDADGRPVSNPEFTPIDVTSELSGTIEFEASTYGVYQYEIYQEDLYGNESAKITKWIRYNFPPYVEIYADEADFSVYLGNPIIFTLDAGDGDGTITEYRWVIDGVPYTKVVGVDDTPDQLTHTFTTLGVHEVEVTVVNFQTSTGLFVLGGIVLQGTAEQPIILTGVNWKGMEISSPAIVTGISHLVISRAERGLALISLSPAISNVRFDQNTVGLHLYDSNPQINQCIFTNNIYFGIKEDADSNPAVLNSTFTGNGLSAYYDEDLTWLSVDELNQIPGNQGNTP